MCNLVLSPVNDFDEQVQAIILEGIEAFNANLPGPFIYCRDYEKYNYILTKAARAELLEVFEQDLLPTLRV